MCVWGGGGGGAMRTDNYIGEATTSNNSICGVDLAVTAILGGQKLHGIEYGPDLIAGFTCACIELFVLSNLKRLVSQYGHRKVVCVW